MPLLPPTQLLTTDQGELPSEVQTQLERDALWFIEHPNTLSFKRPYCPGEAYPYQMPNRATVVTVYRTKRLFTFGDRHVLEIIATQPAGKTYKRVHQPFSVREIQLERAAKRKQSEL